MATIVYVVNILGFGANFLATILLIWYSPNTQNANGYFVTQFWEQGLVAAFKGAIKGGHASVLLLVLGCGAQFFALLMQPLCKH